MQAISTSGESQRGTYSRIYRTATNDSPKLARRNAQREIARLAKEASAGGTYLAIGAGRGFTERPIYPSLRHLNMVLTDIARRRPLMPKRRFANVLNVDADAHELPLKDNSVDVASCLMSQDFYKNRSQATIEAFRVLKPGATLVLYLHHPEMFRRGFISNPAAYKGAVGDFWRSLFKEKRLFETEHEVREFYTMHGFKVQSVRQNESVEGAWWEVLLKKPGLRKREAN